MRLARITVILALLNTISLAQFLPPMQASTREEFDDYLELLEAGTAETKIDVAGRFQQKWPRSELLTHVCYTEAEAQRSLGRPLEAQRAVENALRAAKDNIPALVLLAEILSNESRKKLPLGLAESSARRALQLTEAFRAPRFVPLKEIQTARARIVSRSHSALGVVAYKLGDTTTAIREFEQAETAMPEPDAAILFRLGRLYKEVARFAESMVKMRQVSAMSEPILRSLAEKELNSLQRERKD